MVTRDGPDGWHRLRSSRHRSGREDRTCRRGVAVGMNVLTAARDVALVVAPDVGPVPHPDGSFTYTPPSGFTGTDTFVYTVTDAAGDYAAGTATITVQPPPDTDLSLAQPGNITTDATSPSGATVTYSTPAVTDEDSPVPVASCAPASGSVFAIGTTIGCTVTDSDDTPSTASVSFTITVKGAAAQLADLQAAVQGVGPGTSLPDKVTQAQASLAARNISGTCGTLSAFIHQVTAQSGKSIPKATATALITDAQRIQAVLAC
jgi:hypothetical protein